MFHDPSKSELSGMGCALLPYAALYHMIAIVHKKPFWLNVFGLIWFDIIHELFDKILSRFTPFHAFSFSVKFVDVAYNAFLGSKMLYLSSFWIFLQELRFIANICYLLRINADSKHAFLFYLLNQRSSPYCM